MEGFCARARALKGCRYRDCEGGSTLAGPRNGDASLQVLHEVLVVAVSKLLELPPSGSCVADGMRSIANVNVSRRSPIKRRICLGAQEQ
jgi:hypothetical protein